MNKLQGLIQALDNARERATEARVKCEFGDIDACKAIGEFERQHRIVMLDINSEMNGTWCPVCGAFMPGHTVDIGGK